MLTGSRNLGRRGAFLGFRGSGMGAEQLQTVDRDRKRRETLTFLILAVLIWPFIAVGVVAGWGFIVWMYYLFTGPPGPV